VTGHNRTGICTRSLDPTKKRKYAHKIGRFECGVCNNLFNNMKALTTHAQQMHKLSAIEYTVQVIYNGIRPLCGHHDCDETTRYTRLSFKPFCANHARDGYKRGGAKGGKARAWNKGLTKETDDRIKQQALANSGEKNSFFGKTHSDEIKEQIAVKKRLSWDEVQGRITMRHKNLSVITQASAYTSQNDLLKIYCNTCSNVFEMSLFNLGRSSGCPVCNPFGSAQELEIAGFVESLGCRYVLHDRQQIAPLELDLFMPDEHVAIEYRGLYWHSGGHDDSYDAKLHRRKFLLCEQKGIHLIQIFSDEWNNKRAICESMIRIRLKRALIKIDARKCIVKQIAPTDGRLFLSATHIDGAVLSKAYFGLYHDDRLLSVMSVRVPNRGTYKGQLEIARFASERNTIIRGGAGKLLKYITAWARENGFDTIFSYAELRFGVGNVYTRCGFKHVDDKEINYWYTDGIERFNRRIYRAQKGLSEREYAISQDVRPVHGAGNRVYVRNL